jgi:hypothetical protein
MGRRPRKTKSISRRAAHSAAVGVDLRSGPKKQRLRGAPAPRWSTHKTRSRWFRVGFNHVCRGRFAIRIRMFLPASGSER